MLKMDRLLLGIIGGAIWATVLIEGIGLSLGETRALKSPDRYLSQILYEIVSDAVRGVPLDPIEGYDVLEARLRTILSSMEQPRPPEGPVISRQEIVSALKSCRLIGTVSNQTGHLNAQLIC